MPLAAAEGGSGFRTNNFFNNSRPTFGGGGQPMQQQQSFPRNQHQQHYGFRGKGIGARKNAKERLDHAGVPMTGAVSDCLICCQRSDLFAIGECLHPICMECALRIRMVGDSNQCPQCRTEIPVLYFVCAPPGQQLLLRLPTQTVAQPGHERKYNTKFESQYVVDCFDAYMANRCRECARKGELTDFGTFAELRAHMAQVHQLSFCHICCDNLNVLTKDRRVYTREQLQQHMSGKLAGEEDGFRGHPICQFCEQRFYDDEQQYRHLRKEHYFCQFCDQDGREQNVFYRNQQQLNQHNRRHHHPCLDTDCLQMGIVFRTDMELDVHKARQHHRLAQSATAGGGGRGANIPLDIQFSTNRRQNGFAGGQQQETDENAVESQEQQQQRAAQQSQVVRIVPSAQSGQQPVRIVRSNFPNPLQSTTDFPGLPVAAPPAPYGAPPGWTATGHQSMPAQQQQHYSKVPPPRSLPLQSSEQFPSLGGNQSKPSSSSSSVLGQQRHNSATIWGQKSTKELFAPKPEGDAEAAKKSEERKRAKFVAAPECWPEHMLEKLKAREDGLPDPDPIQPPHWLNPPEKEKKRKAKTKRVSAAAVSSRLAAASSSGLLPSSSKFKTLAAFNESSDETSAKHQNWSAAVKTAPQQHRAHMKLTPSGDDSEFVRIHLPGDERHPRQQQQRAPEAKSTAQLSLEPPPGFESLVQQKQQTGDQGKMLDDNLDGTTAPERGENTDEPQSSSNKSEAEEQKGGIIHLTMRSIASALFGGGTADEEGREEEEALPSSASEEMLKPPAAGKEPGGAKEK